MAPITELILQYENELSQIEFRKFAELLETTVETVSSGLANKINCYKTLLTYAEARNQLGNNADLSREELSKVILDMKPFGYIIPENISSEAVTALENVINQRVKFYQDLLSTQGEFTNWQGLFKQKYQIAANYMQAINDLALAEKIVEGYQDEIAGSVNADAIPLKLKTKENIARTYARRQISKSFLVGKSKPFLF